MLRIRFILLGAAAVAFVGAFASASASAFTHTFLTCLNVGAGKGQWEDSACSKAKVGGGWETSEVANGTKVEGTSGLSELKTKIGAESITILCSKDVFSGEIGKKGTSKGEITFSVCEVRNKNNEKFANCEVPSINFKFVDELVLEENEAKEKEVADRFLPAVAGEPFVIIKINNLEGKICTIKGSYKVTGSQNCLLPSGSTFKVLHNIECLPVGSKLQFEKEEATFKSTESVVLAAPLAGVAWAVL